MKTPGRNELKALFLRLKDNPRAVMTVAVFVVFLDVALLLRAQIISNARLFKKAEQLKTDIRTARTDTQLSSAYKNTVSDLKKEFAALDKMVMSEEDLPLALEAISKFADISAVKILKIRPMLETKAGSAPPGSAPKSAEAFYRQKVAISAKSGFHQLGRLVALLESAPIFFDIRSLEIRTDEQEYMKQSVTIILEVVLKKA